MFCRHHESIRPGPSRKALIGIAGVGYGVDGCLLLAVKPLHSCSEVWVRVGVARSQPLTGECCTSKRMCDWFICCFTWL